MIEIIFISYIFSIIFMIEYHNFNGFSGIKEITKEDRKTYRVIYYSFIVEILFAPLIVGSFSMLMILSKIVTYLDKIKLFEYKKKTNIDD